jgi:hypothetical protein
MEKMSLPDTPSSSARTLGTLAKKETAHKAVFFLVRWHLRVP